MNTKLVILAGGRGTRLNEKTRDIPKPLLSLGDSKPIIWHIMNWYSKHGFKDFVVCLGYKGHLISDYFNVNPQDGWNIDFVDTGLEDGTASRVYQIKKYVGETFFLTYGDGLSNVNLKKLLSFHKKNNKMVTLTAVRPPARFGAIKLKNNHVSYFKEKSKLDEGWINGGFFVMEPKFLTYIKNDKTYLEKEPLEKISKKGQLTAFKHEGYWQCMDTKRDKDQLENLFKKGAPWLKN